MKILNMKLFFALLVSLCLHHSMQGQVQRPRMIVDGNHGMTTLEHLISGESGHGDDDRNYLKINVNGGTKSFIMEESGLFVIGSEDLCLRHHDNVHLSVKGVAIKTDDPLWATPADENHKMYLTPLGNSVDDFMNINFYSYKSEESAPLRYGVLAQQVMPYFPHSIDHFLDDTGIHYTFNPNNLFYSGMKVIQENRQQLDDLETQLQNLETQLQAKQATNDQLAAELEAIKAALADAGIDIPVTPASELESRSATPDDSNLKNAAPRLKQNIPNPFQKSTSRNRFK